MFRKAMQGTFSGRRNVGPKPRGAAAGTAAKRWSAAAKRWGLLLNDGDSMMNQTFFHAKILAAVGTVIFVTVAGLAIGTATLAQAEIVRHSTAGDLFYNEYVPPVGPGSVGAQLYPCPRPTPPLVGHTYITYQPLMPHEFLYKHHRVYTTKHEAAPRTRTSVHWR